MTEPAKVIVINKPEKAYSLKVSPIYSELTKEVDENKDEEVGEHIGGKVSIGFDSIYSSKYIDMKFGPEFGVRFGKTNINNRNYYIGHLSAGMHIDTLFIPVYKKGLTNIKCGFSTEIGGESPIFNKEEKGSRNTFMGLGFICSNEISEFSLLNPTYQFQIGYRGAINVENSEYDHEKVYFLELGINWFTL